VEEIEFPDVPNKNSKKIISYDLDHVPLFKNLLKTPKLNERFS